MLSGKCPDRWETKMMILDRILDWLGNLASLACAILAAAVFHRSREN
jgi:hypothetical protein